MLSLLRVSIFFVILFLLGGCKGEDPDFDSPSKPADGNTSYFTVSIVFSDDLPSASTRASFDGADNVYDSGFFFNYGIDEESDISPEEGANWLLAYNASGQFVASLPLVSFRSAAVSDSNTGKSYKAVCRVNPESLQLSRISSLKIVLNAGSQLRNAIRNGVDLDNLALVQTEAGNYDYLFNVSAVDNGTRRYHSMSSSMVVQNSRTTTALTMGELKYYPTPDQALEKPCATLYVERMQSKYTVLFRPDIYAGSDQFFLNSKVWNYDSNTQSSEQASNNLIIFSPSSSRRVYYVNDFDIDSDMPTVNRGYWKASITGWSINATEPSEFLFKSFGNSPGSLSGWNFTPNGLSSPVRNLWAVDPDYSVGVDAYPDQYRNAFDISTNESVSALAPYQGAENSFPLNYLSFRALSKRDIRQYTSENTYDATIVFNNNKDRLEDRLQFRCGNHIIVGAQLLIEGMEAAGVYNPSAVDAEGLIVSGSDRVITKFFMNNIYWTRDAYINYYCKYLANNIDATTQCKSDLTLGTSFVPNNVFTPAPGEAVFYVRDGSQWRKADYRDFTIQPVYIIGGDGWCYPFPKCSDYNQSATVLHVKQNDNSYRQVSVDEYNKLAYGYPFYFAKGFTEGRMYYAVPVSGNSARENLNNFGLVTGDYGAVRNHWYHYRFTSLTSVGVPVHDPDQPIIPNPEPSLLGLGFEVRIIPWHVVEEDVNI